jgi:hypothetical protein
MSDYAIGRRGRLYFVYSSHKTREGAESALETYFAEGSICEAEAPWIKREWLPRLMRYTWRVMFPAE